MRRRDGFVFRGSAVVTKRREGEREPYEVFQTGKNKIMFGGGSAMWEALMGRWSDNFWDNGNAAIGVGNSGVAEDQTQVDLQGTSKRRPMDTVLDPPFPPIVYPVHVDSFVHDALQILFQSTFDTTEANFHWREWGVFNDLSGGRMLNRKAEDMGLKVLGQIWTINATLLLEC